MKKKRCPWNGWRCCGPAIVWLACASGHASPRIAVADELRTGFARVADQTPQGSIGFPVAEARFVRVLIHRSSRYEPCIDELEVRGPSGDTNLALATQGALASASSLLPGHAIHAIAHLNDGKYGNRWSWIAASSGPEWAQIELPRPTPVSQVTVTRDRLGEYRDRLPLDLEILLSDDGKEWRTVARVQRPPNEGQLDGFSLPASLLPRPTCAGAVEYAFLRERETWRRLPADDPLSPLRVDRPATPGGKPYWGRLARLDPLERVLTQFGDMIGRLEGRGLDAGRERVQLDELRRQAAAASADELYLAARRAKRALFFRDPWLAPLERVLFAKRHPLKPSHNYSEHLDSLFLPGGGIFVLHLPRDPQGRLTPERAEVEQLFDGSKGIVRHPVAGFDAQTIYFAFRPEAPEVAGWASYWHLRSISADGSGLRQLSEGPYHDFDPVPLPDGGLGFMSTRAKGRFLCWRPQTYVLHRMEPDGSGIRRLSFANLSEWDPSVARDGRILWTRSEYQDKGADFGHTLWAIRPDGCQPELVYGNNTANCYGHAREVPGTGEIVCTLISHGDHQGPIALLDPGRGTGGPGTITNITPDTRPQYQMDRSYHETFRDPEPVSPDHFLVSHNPGTRDHWALYLIDRFGNRELLYLDPRISSKNPSPLRPRPRPPVVHGVTEPDLAAQGLGQFLVQDVTQGLGPAVDRGRARYLRVVQEVAADLELLACGEYRSDHPPFQDFYASPVHLVAGPPRSYLTRTPNAAEPPPRAGEARADGDGGFVVTEKHGWPTYVAKAALGTVPISPDGSVNFLAPAGKVLYFQLLDAGFNELQRMRSVVQLQPGEVRSCVGCHEGRHRSPAASPLRLGDSAPLHLEPPPWGPVPFDYQRIVQPVLDARCVRCHDGTAGKGLDLRGRRGPDRVPVSYRTLVAGGWLHYFDCYYGARHYLAEPLSFGSTHSRLWEVLTDQRHVEVRLEQVEEKALKTWIDLNCPLWPDYRHRPERPE